MNRKQIIKNSLRKSPALSGGPRYGGPKGGRPNIGTSIGKNRMERSTPSGPAEAATMRRSEKSSALGQGPRFGGPKGGRPQGETSHIVRSEVQRSPNGISSARPLPSRSGGMHYLAGRRKQKGRVVSPIKPGEFYPGTLGDRKTKGPQYA